MKKYLLAPALAGILVFYGNCSSGEKIKSVPEAKTAAEEKPDAAAKRDVAPGAPGAGHGTADLSPGEPAPHGELDPKAEEKGSLAATVEDKYGMTVLVRKVALFYIQKSLFGSGGEASDHFKIHYGAAEIEIPLREIKSVSTRRVEDKELIGLTIVKRDGKQIKGKISSQTEIRGMSEFGKYKIRLQDVKKIVFSDS
jgi:hypothetical protein